MTPCTWEIVLFTLAFAVFIIIVSALPLTRALLAVTIFHMLGEGVFEHHHPLPTRLLDAIARNRKISSKARQKIITKVLVSFALRSILRSSEVIKVQI